MNGPTADAETAPRPDRIMLVRRRLDVDGGTIDPTARDGASTLVFLHADAAADAGRWARAIGGDPRVQLQVCRTSWRRRCADQAPPGCEPSSLTQLAARLAQGIARIDSYGLGGACCSPDSGSGAFLLEVAYAPAAPLQAQETLEWLLAAASLELDLDVLFSGAGLAQLEGERARGWRQFTDFGLAALYAETPGARAGWPVGVQPVAPRDAAEVRGRAGQVIVL